jgi:hypothetical protein
VNLLYFSIDDDSPTSGLSKKIKSQASALGTTTNELWLLMASRKSGIKLYHYEKKYSGLVLLNHEPGEAKRSLASRYSYYAKKVVSAFESVCESRAINAVYCRRIPMIPCLIKMLKKAKKKYHFALGYEIPTFPYLQEHLKLKQWTVVAHEILFSQSLYNVVDHFFIITDSKNAKKVPFKNWTRITNGIDVEEVPIRQIPHFGTDELHILALANVVYWHGFDRIIKGLADFQSKSRIILHIVGEGPEILKLRKLVESTNLTDQVLFHGPLYGSDLDNIFNICHIAVGSLGLHRIGLDEASVLKVREYCARGIPFIYSPKDFDFPAHFKYILKVPSDESPIKMEVVFDFAKEVLSDMEHPQKMRNYAAKNLDWNVKMNPVIEFFQRSVGDEN